MILYSIAHMSKIFTVKFVLRIDDALDLFAEHAVGGVIGLLLTAFFADSDVIALDEVNTSTNGGWVNQNWKQLYIQFAYVCATIGYSFVITALLAKVVNLVPGLQLRGTPEDERVGMDEIEVQLTRIAIIARLMLLL